MTAALARRLTPAGCGLAIFAGLAALWFADARDSFTAIFALLGINSLRFPFLDLHAIFAAVECHRRGIDVLVSNPCDVLGRLHVYAPLWLHLDILPVTTAWVGPVGFAVDVLFLASLALLPAARHWRGVAVMVIAVGSPAVFYALERGNNDVWIFLLATLAGALLLAAPRWQPMAFIPIVLAAALKYYPAVLLILLVRQRVVRAVTVGAVALAVLVVILLIDRTTLFAALRLVPTGTADSFGAMNVPEVYRHALGWPPWTAKIFQAGLMIWAAARAVAWSRGLRPAVSILPPADLVNFMIGATMMVGCFAAGQSAGYRAIHLLFTLPAMLTLAAVPGSRARIGVTLTVVLMWADAFRGGSETRDSWVWLLQQAGWWVLVCLLSALLIAIVRESVFSQSLKTASERASLRKLLEPARRPRAHSNG